MRKRPLLFALSATAPGGQKRNASAAAAAAFTPQCSARQQRSSARYNFLPNFWEREDRTAVPTRQILDLEQQVRASAQAQLDSQRILDLLDASEDDENDDPIVGDRLPTSSIQIATAAAGASSLATLLCFHNVLLSVITLVVVFVVASADPLDDDVPGALARILGRATLKTAAASRPKMKALARAVVTGQAEIVALQQRVQALERENARLQRWQEVRLQVETALPLCSMEELRDVARQHNIVVGPANKTQLLTKLVEAGVLNLR